MQSFALRESVSRRRSRVECPHCHLAIDLNRLREHLRDRHHLDSANVDGVITEARRMALRGRILHSRSPQ